MLPVVDSCQEANYLDRTAVGADRAFDWDFPFAFNDERCITIRAGQSVQWNGNFGAHPLEQDQGDRPNPISAHGADGVVTFTQPGLFGYRCNYHFEMRGAIQVLPALPAPPTAVAWSARGGPLSIATLLLVAGVWLIRRRVAARRRMAELAP